MHFNTGKIGIVLSIIFLFFLKSSPISYFPQSFDRSFCNDVVTSLNSPSFFLCRRSWGMSMRELNYLHVQLQLLMSIIWQLFITSLTRFHFSSISFLDR